MPAVYLSFSSSAFCQCWGWNQGLCACWTPWHSTTELHPQLAGFKNILFKVWGESGILAQKVSLKFFNFTFQSFDLYYDCHNSSHNMTTENIMLHKYLKKTTVARYGGDTYKFKLLRR
jgi:hypothetical protein